MEESEKMLLRRRRQYVMDTVQLTHGLIRSLSEVGLADRDTVAMLQLEKTNQTRVSRLIDHLIALKSPPDTFRLFCQTLSEDYKWLVRDLVADLKVEKGDVKPRPEVVEEAAALVHRRFGTSKRFSETDKKEMAELIAVKLQIADDQWQMEIDKVKDKLGDATEQLRGRDLVTQKIYDMERAFVGKHEKQLVNHAHDMTTTREFIQRMMDQETPPGGINPLLFVKDKLEVLFKQMSAALTQYESLNYEREKSLRLLGIDDPKVGLEEVISQLTGLTFSNANLETEDKTETIRKLRNRVADLERRLDASDNVINDYQLQLDDRDREISKLRRMVHID